MDARRLEVEWLDELPADDPRARRSRADLRRLNALMGNAGIVAGAIADTPVTIADLGGGDGSFAYEVARGLRERPAHVTIVDRSHVVSPDKVRAFQSMATQLKVVQEDVFEWLERVPDRFDVVIANLFLHHLADEALARLFSLVARRTDCFVACEPRRSSFALAGGRLLGVIGCNDVTRHDAVVSIRAGFRDGELSALWPAGPWRVREEARGLFSHLFAVRRLDA